MSVITSTPTELTREEQLRNRALDLVRTHVLELVCSSDEPLRTVDIARGVAEKLGIPFSAEELGGLASVARLVLDSDPLYSQANRQWDLAFRMGRAEGDRRKPVERAIEDFLDLFGRPVPPAPVAVLVASVYGRLEDYYEKMIDRLLESGRVVFSAGAGTIGGRRWLVELTSRDPDDVEFDNFDDPNVLNPYTGIADDVRAPDAVSFAVQLVERAGKPIPSRVLTFLAWRRFPDTDPARLFRSLVAQEAIVLERGPSWTQPSEYASVLDALRQLVRDPGTAADAVAAAAPAEEDEIGILAPATIRVSDDDLNQVYAHMLAHPNETHRVQDLCQQVLEAFPGSRTYASVHASLHERLRGDSRVVWLGGERFRAAGTLPPEIEQLPEGLAFDERFYIAEEGEDADREIDPRDWKASLHESVQNYLVQDVGDDSTEPGLAPDVLFSSPPLHHYVAGTRYLRHCDAGFFPEGSDIVQVTLETPAGDRFDVWINKRLGLIFGLKEWYDANLPWVGGRFSIRPTEQPDVFRLDYQGDTEPLMDIPLDRLQQLLQLRAAAQDGSLTLTEVVTRILKSHQEPINCVTLFTELNVVRRTRRAQLASILSAHRYFVQHPATPGLWSFDEKRAQKTKAKKRTGPRWPSREAYDEEEDEFEYE